MSKGYQKFFICKTCGNLIGMIFNKGVPMACCGEEMIELVANTEEASTEKHIPVATVDGNKLSVDIGSDAHPMIDEHYIEWVYVETKKGGQRKNLLPGEAPRVEFTLIDDEAVSVFAYCNLHGLWKSQL